MLFLEFFLDPVALEVREVINEQLAVQVIALMLDADGEQAFGNQFVRLAVTVQRLDADLLRAVDVLVETGYRQAAFLDRKSVV